MNILVLCPHFAPDVAPTGVVMTAIGTELAARGHRLHVVTSLPWYRHHRVEVGWEGQLVRIEDRSWGRITRLHPFPTDKSNIPARALAFGGFTALASLEGLLTRSRPDVVLAMSPPLTLGLAGWSVARSRRVPFVFNIQDVFPDVAVELGLLTDTRVIAAASWLERATYRRADAVTVLSEDLARNVVDKLASGPRPLEADEAASRVHVIPNFVDTERIVAAPRDNDYRREFGLGDRTVVMYAGNVGFSQSLDLVLAAARAMVDRTDVVFVINGGGTARPTLEADAAGLDNVVFVDMQPAERLPEVLAAADLHLVPLRKGLARASVPSKLYSILAAGRPVLAAVDPGTEVARTLAAAEAGRAVPPDDPEAFVAALEELLDGPDVLTAMGAAGRRFVEAWASPAAVAASYEALFEQLIAARSRHPVGLAR
ncbi:MAG: glycosyltransferase family 4 protein [Acidimicrobiia bacterium]|nr:glycosyltransferase family 4 protein [Acidimicrobiia bacterium]